MILREIVNDAQTVPERINRDGTGGIESFQKSEHLPARVQGQQKDQPLPFNEHLSFKDAKEQLLESFEREYIMQVLKRCDGNISRAARESGLHRKSIERLVKKYSLDTRSMKVK